MNTSSNNNSSKTVGIACGLFFFAYLICYNHILNVSEENRQSIIAESHKQIEQPIHHHSNITNSGQRTRRRIKSIRVIPTVETYEVSRWITSGDWSHDNEEWLVDIPSEKVVMDVDYVEDNWDNFVDDPEDEILYPPELFQ